MPLRTLLGGFLVWILYPLWLVAGGIDYFCHRQTDIEHTSGPTESSFHLAEFISIGFIVASAALLEITLAVLVLMLAAACVHTVLSFVDVSYTIGRRRITVLEQHVHGVLNVLPFMAVALFAMLNWNELLTGSALRWKDAPLAPQQQLILIGSFVILAGAPVLEELFRTRQHVRDEHLIVSSQR